MPTYQYACKACDNRLEAVLKFTDDHLTVCPECGGPLRQVFSSVGVVFKGSGFYRTDSRSSSKTGSTSSTTTAAATDGASTSSADKPASSTTSASTSTSSSDSGKVA